MMLWDHRNAAQIRADYARRPNRLSPEEGIATYQRRLGRAWLAVSILFLGIAAGFLGVPLVDWFGGFVIVGGMVGLMAFAGFNFRCPVCGAAPAGICVAM